MKENKVRNFGTLVCHKTAFLLNVSYCCC